MGIDWQHHLLQVMPGSWMSLMAPSLPGMFWHWMALCAWQQHSVQNMVNWPSKQSCVSTCYN